MDCACLECGALHWTDECIQKTRSTNLHLLFGRCCGDGKICLPAPPPLPDLLKRLFSASTAKACQFHEHIHQYNVVLSFTSLGVQVDDSINCGGGGPLVFKIHSGLHHWIGSLLPPSGQSLVYAQLYSLDSVEASGHRMERNGNLDPDLMSHLGGLISGSHHWACFFKQVHKVLHGLGANQVSLQLMVSQNKDRQTYNLPTSSEVAAVIPGDMSEGSGSHDIVLHKRDGSLRRVYKGSLMYESL